MARFAVGIAGMVKSIVIPVTSAVMALVAFARPVTRGRRMASGTILGCVVCEQDVIPAVGAMAFTAHQRPMIGRPCVTIGAYRPFKVVWYDLAPTVGRVAR